MVEARDGSETENETKHAMMVISWAIFLVMLGDRLDLKQPRL